MISRRELRKISEEKGVPKSTIEKDWMLGYFLGAIFNIKEFKNYLIIKEGTCLKKCYYKEYGFSDDLDFTSRDPDLKVSEDHIREVARIAEEKSGAPTSYQSFRELFYKDKLTGYEGKIQYYGPDHNPNVSPPPPERWTTNVKIEITLYEKLLSPGVIRSVYHPYSDTLSSAPLKVPAYEKCEIIAEKIRSLVQRSYTAPRDYYDIWYIIRSTTFDKEILKEKISEKMAYKGKPS